MGLYADLADADVADALSRRQAQGVRRVSVAPRTRRFPVPGPIVFGRGLEIRLTVDEIPFAGASAFLLGAVLEQFFARYVSINSFTQTVICTLERGEIKRWPARIGTRALL
jgi:type VI secretion system protein ImpG